MFPITTVGAPGKVLRGPHGPRIYEWRLSSLKTFPFFAALSCRKPLSLLRSAVGMTHDLRSDLWWNIPLRILLGQFWDTSWIPPDQVSHRQIHRCPGACGSRQMGHVVIFWYLPYPAYGYTWVVLWLLFFRSAPSTFLATLSTFKGPFRGVPSR